MTYAQAYYGGAGSGASTSGTAEGGKLALVRGDAYDDVANPAISITVGKDFTGWSGVFTVRHRLTESVICTASITVVSSSLLRVTLSTVDTAFALLTTADDFGPHPYDIELTSGASVQTIRGVVVVARDQTAS